MKTAKDLTEDEKNTLIDKLQELAFGDTGRHGNTWNPNALENNDFLADAGEELVTVLKNAGLAPDREMRRRIFQRAVVTVVVSDNGVDVEDLEELVRAVKNKEAVVDVSDARILAHNLTAREAADEVLGMGLDPVQLLGLNNNGSAVPESN